ncbi:restriction endonuclease subunit S [Pseudoalteromonas sp. NGC95]|uniref:restriction endonuclease subunit S n=1 Tax=Pseudoalteromonas sp. NGC95 TaxID=2792051 RepID=UPI0018CEB0ED|nr:restriction endonuclease subunit S [Pseudoalteromonas sp. NGC95]MBH0015177.1 restriction endonuclease subunit S [Pseudoalteromonas sp. NGC95]
MRITNEKLGNIIETLTDYHANGSYEKLKENVELLPSENYAVMIRTTNFSQNNFYENLNYITESAYNYLKKSKVYAGDIVMNKIADAGACYFMPEIKKPVSLGMNLFLIRINKQLANSFFIYSYLKFHEFYVKSFASGSATKTITKEDVRKLKIYLPEIGEQQKIANILETWDKAISTTERLIDNSKQQKKALMQQLLTGKKRLLDDSGKPFEGEWKEIEVGQLTKIYDGTHSTPKYVEEGVPFYSVEHLTRNDFSRTKFISEDVFEKENKRVKLERNDILMTRIGDIGTAKCLTWDVQASFYVSLALFKSNVQFDSNYLTYYINSKDFHRELWKRTIHVAFPKKINLGEISHCLVQLPPLVEQVKIAAILTSADQEIELLEQQLADLKQEKKALMQQLLTGKRRVKVDDKEVA